MNEQKEREHCPVKIVARALPTSLEDLQLNLDLAFAAGAAYGQARASLGEQQAPAPEPQGVPEPALRSECWHNGKHHSDFYTADQMREYAAACVAAALERVQAERDELRRKAEFCEIFERGGWFVEHCPPSSYLTDEANAEHAFMARRTMPPFEVNKTRHWTGPTPTEALKRAAAAIARTEGDAP